LRQTSPFDLNEKRKKKEKKRKKKEKKEMKSKRKKIEILLHGKRQEVHHF